MSETTLPDLGSAKVRIVADKSGLKDGLKSAEDDAKKAVEKIQASLMDLGRGLSAGITAPILALGATAAASMESLNKAMITLRAGTGAVGGAMKGLHDDFLAVLRNADEPVQVIAQDMALLNQRTGMTGEGLQTLTEQFQILQKYTGEKPIREVTRVFGDWSVAAEDQVAVMDELYRAYQRTGVSITELATNMVQYGAPMRVLGFSLHETIALFAKWNMEGVNTVNLMGGLRMMLAKFNAGGVKDAKAAFEGLAEAIRGAKDFAGGVTIANALMGGDKSGAFGVRNTNDTVAAIREGRFELSGLVADLINSNETLKGIDAEGQTLADTFGRFKNALVAAFDPLTKQYQTGLASFGDALAGLAGGIDAVVGAFSRLDGGAQVAILAIAGIAAAAGPLMIGLSGLLAVWGLVGASFLAVAGPAAVVIAALVAVVAAVAGLRGAWMAFQPEIRSGMQAVSDWFSDGFNFIGTVFTDFTQSLRALDTGWLDSLNSMGANIWNFAGQVKKAAKEIIGSIIGIGMTSEAAARGNAVGPDWLKNWQIQMGQGWDTVKGLFQNKGFEGEDISQIFGPLDGAAGKFEKLTSKMGANQTQTERTQFALDELTGAMGKAQKAAVTLEDALSMRQGARPLEAMTAELKKVMDMAARFPTVIDQETIALLTGKAFESGGGKIPFAAAYDALMLLNPAMAETILEYKALSEAQKQFQDGLALTEETARLEAEAMRDVFKGLEVVAEKTKKEMTKEEKQDFFAGMMGTLAGVGGQLERITGKASGLSKALTLVGGVANMAVNAVKSFAAGCAAGGPLVGILNAAVSVLLDALGLMDSATEKVKTGFERMTDEVSKKWNEWTDRLTDSIVEFIETGKFAFDDFVKSIAEDLLKIGIKWAVIQPVLHMMGVPNSAFAAKGLVNDGGHVSKFAGGGVVTRPMSFSMGMGLIGEGAKPAEAYVPLTRTRSGDLGVSVEGMATGAKVNVVVNNYGAAPVTKTESVDADGTRNITLIVENIVKKAFARGSMDSVLGSVMGARRTGVQYG
jgi:phage-related minor tail protein